MTNYWKDRTQTTNAAAIPVVCTSVRQSSLLVVVGRRVLLTSTWSTSDRLVERTVISAFSLRIAERLRRTH